VNTGAVRPSGPDTSIDAVTIGGCGANLASLAFALQRIGVSAPVTEDPQRIRAATHVLLPGVGAARDAMRRLTATGIADLVPSLTQPVLGICLGMQLLFSHSEEDDARCLGVIGANVTRLPRAAGLPVPHMGWNEVRQTRPSALLGDMGDHEFAYFVHSYAAPPGDYTLAESEYGVPFSAVVQQGNFYGMQFHPERSSAFGSRLLSNFFRL
jgi:imidazole glycerol-phosphate synthase subunit HisH